MEVKKTIDDFVHHYGLCYCPMITEWLEGQFGDKPKGTCGGAEVLCDLCMAALLWTFLRLLDSVC